KMSKALVVAGAAAGVLALGISASAATPTWTVKAGTAKSGATASFKGTTTGKTPQITHVDKTTALTLTIKSGTASSTAKVGKGKAGAGIASISGSSTTWKTCVGPLGIQLNPKGSGTWKLNAVSYKSGVTTGTLTAAAATVSTPDKSSCVFSVTGSVPITYTNSTQILAVKATAANLTVSKVTGCFGLIKNKDKASFAASYKVVTSTKATNPLSITSP
ncbi:hypothetical protein, partial [Jatrophihabitans sp.]|uniref:hypothetical protein n=1 Tax=Jatrophihabitans sp. TaxID=1932789 RepID=UPI0030C687EA|nr:hypothetical protein [Jatrophihabitans sp.]